MKDNFAGRLILFGRFFFFFQHLEYNIPLLDCKVSTENPAASLMGIPSYLTSYFSFLHFFFGHALMHSGSYFPN